MENEGQVPMSAPPVVTPYLVSEGSIRLLGGTRPWVRLVSILMYVGVGLMILSGLVMMVAVNFLPKTGEGIPGPFGAVPGMVLGGIYIAMSLLYLFPAIYLSRYAKAIARLQESRAVAELEQALHQQKSFWKFVGVMAIVGMVITVIGMVAAISIPLVLMLLGKGGPPAVSM